MSSPASEETPPDRRPPTLPKPRRRRWLTVLLVFFAAVAIRGSQIQGIWGGVVVSGPSMAPTLWGPHWQANCKECQFPFRFNDPSSSLPSRWECPNCGTTQAAPLKQAAGQQVWIDRAAYWFALPQRDELVAIQDDEGWRVKRVVGLPGESLRFADGEFWIDGKPWEKSLRQLRARSVTVYDDRHRGSTRRWSAFSNASWQPIDNGYRATRREPPDIQWLRYAHYSLYNREQSWHATPVRDDDAMNPNSRHALFNCHDLWLRGHLNTQTPADLFCLFWTPSGVVGTHLTDLQGSHVFESARLDGRLWISLDGNDQCVSNVDGKPHANLLSQEFIDRIPENLLDDEHPIAVGCYGKDSVTISELRLNRDLLLLGPHGLELDWDIGTLKAEQYFVLGDNVAVSIDSRQKPEGVPREQILGRVIP